MITPLIFIDSYGLKEAFKHKYCGSKPSQKISRALPSRTSYSSESIFSRAIPAEFLKYPQKYAKMSIILRFCK